MPLPAVERSKRRLVFPPGGGGSCRGSHSSGMKRVLTLPALRLASTFAPAAGHREHASAFRFELGQLVATIHDFSKGVDPDAMPPSPQRRRVLAAMVVPPERGATSPRIWDGFLAAHKAEADMAMVAAAGKRRVAREAAAVVSAAAAEEARRAAVAEEDALKFHSSAHAHQGVKYAHGAVQQEIARKLQRLRNGDAEERHEWRSHMDDVQRESERERKGKEVTLRSNASSDALRRAAPLGRIASRAEGADQLRERIFATEARRFAAEATREVEAARLREGWLSAEQIAERLELRDRSLRQSATLKVVLAIGARVGVMAAALAAARLATARQRSLVMLQRFGRTVLFGQAVAQMLRRVMTLRRNMWRFRAYAQWLLKESAAHKIHTFVCALRTAPGVRIRGYAHRISTAVRRIQRWWRIRSKSLEIITSLMASLLATHERSLFAEAAGIEPPPVPAHAAGGQSDGGGRLAVGGGQVGLRARKPSAASRPATGAPLLPSGGAPKDVAAERERALELARGGGWTGVYALDPSLKLTPATREALLAVELRRRRAKVLLDVEEHTAAVKVWRTIVAERDLLEQARELLTRGRRAGGIRVALPIPEFLARQGVGAGLKEGWMLTVTLAQREQPLAQALYDLGFDVRVKPTRTHRRSVPQPVALSPSPHRLTAAEVRADARRQERENPSSVVSILRQRREDERAAEESAQALARERRRSFKVHTRELFTAKQLAEREKAQAAAQQEQADDCARRARAASIIAARFRGRLAVRKLGAYRVLERASRRLQHAAVRQLRPAEAMRLAPVRAAKLPQPAAAAAAADASRSNSLARAPPQPAAAPARRAPAGEAARGDAATRIQARVRAHREAARMRLLRAALEPPERPRVSYKVARQLAIRLLFQAQERLRAERVAEREEREAEALLVAEETASAVLVVERMNDPALGSLMLSPGARAARRSSRNSQGAGGPSRRLSQAAVRDARL
ncbi:hypothetical protein T492DRAFT_1149664 [Pavlovales sp. CCMP2436]|nr:hypothetical protein T492DRAFT_1149664 [Pavlovales sp. CCMP2436]